MRTRFESKVDWWIGLLLASGPVVVLVTLLPAVFTGAVGVGPFLLSLGICPVIYGVLIFPMYYELDGEALVIRFGLVRSRVDYRDIKRVVPTRNPVSSPALSLDRLHVDAGSSLGPNISPADKSGFLDALAERTAHLRREEDALVPVR